MNNIGKKKSIKDVDNKYNTERNEETVEQIHETGNINDTSKMDLSEIQEENPIAEPVNNFQATDRSLKKHSLNMNQEKMLLEKVKYNDDLT